MAWAYLLLATLFEVIWVVTLRSTENFSKLMPSVLNITAMICIIVFLNAALRTLPVGPSYAIWKGLATIGIVTCGILLFQEKWDLVKLFYLGLILVGVVGLSLKTIS